MRNGKVKYIDGIWRRSVWVFDLHWDWDLDCILELLLLPMLLLLLLLLSPQLKVSIYLLLHLLLLQIRIGFIFQAIVAFSDWIHFSHIFNTIATRARKQTYVQTNERNGKNIEYKYSCTNNSNRQKYIFLSHSFATEQIEKEKKKYGCSSYERGKI